MNSLLDKLQPYPFARLRQAMQGIEPPAHLKPVMLQIGEPKHPTPAVITQALNDAAAGFAQYPLTAGLPELRQACARWLHRRYDGLTLDPESEILPVLGSREALFSFAQVILDPAAQERQIVACPNPFYQIYEGAAFLGGGEIHFANSTPPALPARLEQRARICLAARAPAVRLLARQPQRQRDAARRLV